MHARSSSEILGSQVPLRVSLLERDSPVPTRSLSHLQRLVDDGVGGFVHEATDWRFLASMTAGQMACRASRVGILGFGRGYAGQALSIGGGLCKPFFPATGVHV